MISGLDRTQVRGLCFDIDGTLADTDDALAVRLARALRPLAPLLPGRDPLQTARALLLGIETPANSLYALADRLGLDEIAGPLLDALHRVRGEGRPHHFQLIPGLPKALARLHLVYPLAIVSSRGERGVQAFLDQFSFTSLFRCVASARTCRRTKPHPAPLLWAAREMGLPPEACVMVGDTAVDIRAARAAGAQSVGVLCGFGERAELERAGADLILRATPDLVDVLLTSSP
jgi:phosphoglycolate phosphatase-like HAD superfamily hydrolase